MVPTTPLPKATVIEEVPVKPTPLRVTGMLAVPGAPVLGAMEFSVGAGCVVTVNDAALVVPFGVVTVNVCALPSVAPPVMVKVVETAESFNTVTPPGVTPVPEAIFTDDAPLRLVPVRTTGTLAPWPPEVGAMEYRAALVEAAAYWTAPISIPPLFLGWP